MVSDGHDGIWVGGQFGLFHYDSKTHAYEVFPAAGDGATATPVRLKRVFSLYVDREGALWVGGDGGVQVKRPGSATFDDIPGLEGAGEAGRHPYVWSFLEDQAGRLWIGCDHVGLARYDPVAHVLRGVPGLTGTGSEIGEHTVRGILEHAPGQLWIATYGGGLITYQVKDGHIRSFSKSDGTNQPLKNNFLRDLFKDRSGVVWLATDNGIATINDSTAGIYQIHPALEQVRKNSGTEVRSVAEVNGQIWIGLDQGEFGTLEQEAKIKPVLPAPGEPESQVSGREILAIQGDGKSTLYAGGTGLFKIDAKNNTYRKIRDPLIVNEVVSTIAINGDEVMGRDLRRVVPLQRPDKAEPDGPASPSGPG